MSRIKELYAQHKKDVEAKASELLRQADVHTASDRGLDAILEALELHPRQYDRLAFMPIGEPDTSVRARILKYLD